MSPDTDRRADVSLWNADKQPIEISRSLYRGDRYRAVLRIPRHIME